MLAHTGGPQQLVLLLETASERGVKPSPFYYLGSLGHPPAAAGHEAAVMPYRDTTYDTSLCFRGRQLPMATRHHPHIEKKIGSLCRHRSVYIDNGSEGADQRDRPPPTEQYTRKRYMRIELRDGALLLHRSGRLSKIRRAPRRSRPTSNACVSS
ncbi:Protein of unknown function [Gryllus bimaculatus]|nr:Protein of unknown function [Gryllus bimaculatus]